MLENLLKYPEGTVSSVYNSGPGKALDRDATTEEDSKMVVISATSEKTFESYVQKLVSEDFSLIFKNQIDDNIYYYLKNGNKKYYIYYTAYSQEVRIIEDNSTKTLLSDLDSPIKGTGKTEFYLYSLDYTHGEGQTSKSDYWKIDCGALMLVKLADNSLFIIDSGHDRQSSDAAMEGLMKFMYQITGKHEGTKINIRSWIFSHAHGDHVHLAHALIEKYHDYLNLEGVLHNFPSYHEVRGSYDPSTFLMKESVNKYYPDCKYAKLFTGQKFNLQGMQIEMLYSHEDAVGPDGKSTISDFNNTSIVFKLIFDGKSIMMLGDSNTNLQEVMLKMYSDETLKCDGVQVTHHNYNDMAPLYTKIGAPLALIPNSPENAGPESGNAHKYQGVVNAAENVTVLYADPYTYKITVENGEFKFEAIPSYRENFKMASVPDLSENLVETSAGKIIKLEDVLKKVSLREYLIDRSVIGTDAANTSESAYLIFDDNTSTKYCTENVPATISWTMKKPVTVESYVIYTAADSETYKGRNPQKWVLCGSCDGKYWDVIDSVNMADLPGKNSTGIAFDVKNPVPYQFYVLKVFETAGEGGLQFSELKLYGRI